MVDKAASVDGSECAWTRYGLQWTDLTSLCAVEGIGETPFDAGIYETLFDDMARALFRRKKHVVLVGDRGVGTNAVTYELARRSASGQIPHLAEAKIVSLDCRFTAPDESRDRLRSVFAVASDEDNLVLCIDGFGALLRSDRGTNKSVLLSAIVQLNCRIVGLTAR